MIEKKFGVVSLELNAELIKFVNDRDTQCVYCGIKLKDNYEYDHLNPFKPISKNNIVRCCLICNHSKNNANVLEWLEFKGIKPSQIVLDLLENQKSTRIGAI